MAQQAAQSQHVPSNGPHDVGGMDRFMTEALDLKDKTYAFWERQVRQAGLAGLFQPTLKAQIWELRGVSCSMPLESCEQAWPWGLRTAHALHPQQHE